ncbi:MAG: SLC13 family permease [Hyphomicrobiaceae bacterium]
MVTPVWRLLPLILGPALAGILLLLPPPGNMPVTAWSAVAITSWMVVWWLSEAVPLPATALLPIPFMPFLDIGDIKSVCASYAHPLIFLFLGGFILAAAMQRCGLHRRIALNIISFVGTSNKRIIAGFMLATSFLSMWISNTATTVMMYAVGLSVIQLVASRVGSASASRFGIALMLGIAYSASIGGVGTLIGTPPNALLASILQSSYSIEIDFVTWMMFGLPVVVVMLLIAWVLLAVVLFPTADTDESVPPSILKEEMAQLGPPTRTEKMVLVVFALAVMGWCFGKPIGVVTGVPINDTAVAILASVALFAIPVSLNKQEFLVDWETAKKLPWGILLIFGGGLAITGAFNTSGLAAYLGNSMKGFGTLGVWTLVLVTGGIMIALTEITSNTASAATFLPILGAIAVGLGYDPRLLMIPVALGASMAFMMPVATPPNAIVFSYDGLKIQDMVRAGIWLNIVATLVCFGAMYLLAGLVFGIAPA